MTNEEVYRRMQSLVAEMPELGKESPVSAATYMWLGRVGAMLSQMARTADGIALTIASDKLPNGHMGVRREAVAQIHAIIFRALAWAEARAPAAAQGAFIAVGQPFDAFAAIGRVLAEAKNTAMIVDPYMDANALTDFAVLAAPAVEIQLLTDADMKKAPLEPAVRAWQGQYLTDRTLDARKADRGLLHDRLIILDKQTVWLLTQSLNAFAKRSPATIAKIDTETAVLKIAAYGAIWSAANPI